MKALCSIFGLHVVGATCDYLATRITKTPFRETLQRSNCSESSCDRMAAKPESFAKAGFFYSCRPTHVSTEPEWAASKKTPATLHPRQGRLNFDQVSVKSCRQAVRQLHDESEWSAYGRASLSRNLGIRWAGLITLGGGIV